MNEEALLASVEESDRPLLVVLTGAGISAESGLKTFRDADGLWENHPVHEVASIDGWHANPELVLEFYNQRRAQLLTVAPNAGHHTLKALEAKYLVVVITQNVDDLHERAGSTHIVHLHGELRKIRTVVDADWTDDIGGAPIRLGDRGPDGTQLRPHIVWFGEEVPLLPLAARITSRAEVLLVVGTSLAVYPAASLIDYAPADCPKYYVDPRPASIHGIRNLEVIAEAAGTGLPKLAERLMA
jgi:NAD-dependent deacetylase